MITYTVNVYTPCVAILQFYIESNYAWGNKIIYIKSDPLTSTTAFYLHSSLTTQEQQELDNLMQVFDCSLNFTDPNAGNNVNPGDVVNEDNSDPVIVLPFYYHYNICKKQYKILYYSRYPYSYAHSKSISYICPGQMKMFSITFDNYYSSIGNFTITVGKKSTTGTTTNMFTWNITQTCKRGVKNLRDDQTIMFDTGDGIYVSVKNNGKRNIRGLTVNLHVKLISYQEKELYFNN